MATTAPPTHDWRPELAAWTERLLVALTSLDDLSTPSLCVGWSRAHVLSHLGRNAAGLDRALRGLAAGRPVPVYDSAEAREADIRRGASASAAELRHEVRTTAEALAQSLAGIDPQDTTGVERTPGSVGYRVCDVPFARLREVVLHHVDLRADLSLDEVDPALLQALLMTEIDRLRASKDAPSLKLRTDEGDVHSIGGGDHYVTGTRAGALAWLSRGSTEGVHADSLPTIPKGR